MAGAAAWWFKSQFIARVRDAFLQTFLAYDAPGTAIKPAAAQAVIHVLEVQPSSPQQFDTAAVENIIERLGDPDPRIRAQAANDLYNAAQLDPELYDFLSGPAQQEYSDNAEIASRIRTVVKQVWPYFSSIGGDTIQLVIRPTTGSIAPLNDATRIIDISLDHGDNAAVFFIPNAGQNWENAQSAEYEIGAGGDKPWIVPNLIKIEPLHAGPEFITVRVSEFDNN